MNCRRSPKNSSFLDNEIVITADGSHTLRSHRFGVPYHSIHGAVQESRHVFIAAGLEDRLDNGLTEINILETGFGTGLNALLVWEAARLHPGVQLNYLGLERYPVAGELVNALNYPAQTGCSETDFRRLHELAWGEQHLPGANFSFRKQEIDFAEALAGLPASDRADVLFFDAFAPASQPELWEQPLLTLCYEALRPGGVLVTYCAKGQFKRDLRSVGFTVEPLPGPPGKREMTRARKK